MLQGKKLAGGAFLPHSLTGGLFSSPNFKLQFLWKRSRGRFLGKIFVWPKSCQESPEWCPKLGFNKLLKNVMISFCCKWLKLKIELAIQFPVQTSQLRLYLLSRYNHKYSQPIRFEDFLISNISWTVGWRDPNILHADR